MCPAQHLQQFTPVRYHFGDDARWADPNRDDNFLECSRRWSRAYACNRRRIDGFVRSRVRVAVPHNMAGPLAIRWDTGQNGPNVQEVYVNGVRVMIRDESAGINRHIVGERAFRRHSSEVGAMCGSSARTDCTGGGQR